MLYVYPMGWLRLVGSLKLHVSFAEYSLFYSSLLQKRPVILRSLLVKATQYVYLVYSMCALLDHVTIEFFEKKIEKKI